MKVDLETILKELNRVQETQGDLYVFIAIGLIVDIGVLITFLKYRTKAIAEEASKKSIAGYESNLAEKLQTKIGLFFRDEAVRNNLLTHVGTKSIDTKIDLWQKLYNLYFIYQTSWNFDASTNIEEYSKIDKELNELRNEILKNTIYLGGELSVRMIRANSLMRDNLRNKRTVVHSSAFSNTCQVEMNMQNNEQKLSEHLTAIEKWITSKLSTDQNLEKYEFSDDQLEKIKNERDKKFDTLE